MQLRNRSCLSNTCSLRSKHGMASLTCTHTCIEGSRGVLENFSPGWAFSFPRHRCASVPLCLSLLSIYLLFRRRQIGYTSSQNSCPKFQNIPFSKQLFSSSTPAHLYTYITMASAEPSMAWPCVVFCFNFMYIYIYFPFLRVQARRKAWKKQVRATTD